MERTTAVLYSTAVCNLNCTYCYINKNQGLKAIDNVLAESFADPEYYFNFIRDYFPHRGDLLELEVWGAETFLHMERVFPTLHKLIGFYPFFRRFFASTNFSYPDWPDKVLDLLNQFSGYAPRRFDVHLQLSLDGPEHITDQTRGRGVTRLCLQNYDRLLERADEIPENVSLFLAFKPTLSIDTMYQLDTKEEIIEYYRFFEDLIQKVVDLNRCNLNVNYPVPNVGVPVPAGKADGEYFAWLVRNCREIEQETPFRFYREITPFSTNVRPRDEDTYNYPCFNCGTGSKNVGFLPNRLISSCHNGFVDVLEDYEKHFQANPDSSIDAKLFQPTHNKFTHTEAEYAAYEKQISHYNAPGSLCRMGCLAGFIRTLALAGEIEEKYATEEGAFRGAELYQSCTCNCMRDNYMVTGSTSLQPEGMIKLLLNGAVDHIIPDCRKDGEEEHNVCS